MKQHRVFAVLSGTKAAARKTLDSCLSSYLCDLVTPAVLGVFVLNVRATKVDARVEEGEGREREP